MSKFTFEQDVKIVNENTFKRIAEGGKVPKRLSKPTAWQYPRNIERKLQVQYSNVVKAFNNKVKDLLFPLLPEIFGEAELDKRVDNYDSESALESVNSVFDAIKYDSVYYDFGNGPVKLHNIKVDETQARFDELRADDWVDTLRATLASLTLASNDNVLKIETLAEATGPEIANFNESQLRKLTRQVLSVDILTDDPWLRNEVRMFAAQNVSLIKSIQDKSITDIEGIIQRNLQQGNRSSNAAKQIQEKFKTTRKRAKFIARDQTNKLNGAITKTRQQSLGIDTYFWRDSDDEKVRETHRNMDGKLCRWDDPTVYSDDGGQTWQPRSEIGGVEMHPGEDFNCRCSAEPNFQGFIEQIA